MNNIGKIIWIFVLAVSIVSTFILVQEPAEKTHIEVTGQIITPDVVQVVEKPKKLNKKEIACVRQALWHEARNQPIEGIKAVASVIVNRINHKNYPNTYCEVIYQQSQFSFVKERLAKGKTLDVWPKPSEYQKYNQIENLAIDIVTNKFKPTLPSNVLHYTRIEINNYWTKTKKIAVIIKDHKFLSEQK